MTSPTNSAIAAAAKVQRYDLVEHGSYYSEGSIDPVENGEYVLHSDYAALLAKLAEVEKERDAYRNRECQALEAVAEYLDVLENAPDELTTDGLRGLFVPGNWSDVLSQRDSALTRAEQSEALLREADEAMKTAAALMITNGTCNGDGHWAYRALESARDHISAHLAPKETT